MPQLVLVLVLTISDGEPKMKPESELEPALGPEPEPELVPAPATESQLPAKQISPVRRSRAPRCPGEARMQRHRPCPRPTLRTTASCP